MKKLELEQMEKIEGGKFWGKSCKSGVAEIFNAVTGEWVPAPYTYCCSYVFWINTGCGYE